MAEGMSKQEILVKLRADARDMVNSFKEARNAIKSQTARIQEDIDSIRFTKRGTRRKRYTAEEKEDLERLRVKYKQLGTELKSMSAKQGHAMTNMRGSINKVRKDVDATKKSIGGLGGLLLQASLSAMFFGMAMRQAALTVWRTTTKTFQDVSHSVGGSVTQFDLLRGSLKYLQFSVGQALEPLAAALIPIVDLITEFVIQNPELVQMAVAFGAIAGSILMVGGQIGSFVSGMKALGGMLGGAKASLTALTTTFGTGLLPLLGIIAAAAVVIWAMWKTNFGNIREFVGEVFSAIWEFLKNAFDNIKQILSGVFKVIEGIFAGDWKMVMKGFLDILFGAVKLIMNAFGLVGDIVISVFEFAVNIVKDLIFGLVKLMIGRVEFLAMIIDKVFGSDLQSKIAGVRDKISEVQDSLTLDFEGGVVQNLVDKGTSGLDSLQQTIIVEIDGEEVANKAAEHMNRAVQ